MSTLNDQWRQSNVDCEALKRSIIRRQNELEAKQIPSDPQLKVLRELCVELHKRRIRLLMSPLRKFNYREATPTQAPSDGASASDSHVHISGEPADVRAGVPEIATYSEAGA